MCYAPPLSRSLGANLLNAPRMRSIEQGTPKTGTDFYNAGAPLERILVARPTQQHNSRSTYQKAAAKATVDVDERLCSILRRLKLTHKMENYSEDYSLRRLSNLSAVLDADEGSGGLGGTALLIVDPQRDFHEGGSLAVPGAIEDAARIAQLITSHAECIDELIVTLDSHHVSKLKKVFHYQQILTVGAISHLRTILAQENWQRFYIWGCTRTGVCLQLTT